MNPAPTPAKIDQLAAEFFALKKKLLEALSAADQAQAPLDALKQELVSLVSNFGSAHAEKSKLLHGISSEMMVTFASSVSIDGGAVEKFRLALVANSQARILKRVFEKTVRWTLAPKSSEIIKGEKLSKSLLALYSQCEVIKPRAPTLAVREKSA